MPKPKKPHVTYYSGNNEWYTPKEYVDAARLVLGGIDLDPASCAIANKAIQAGRYYTKESNGLTQPWYGRIWLNPPYAAGLVAQFADKLSHHVQEGDVEAAIVLVNNATETVWFNTLAGMAAAAVFPKRRIQFIMPDGGKKGSPIQGQTFLYIGNHPGKFLRIFQPFGWGVYVSKEKTA